MTMSNIFLMLPETPMMRQVETGTQITVTTITWLMIGAFSKKLTTPSKSKFDWEMTPQWSQKEKALSWWRKRKV